MQDLDLDELHDRPQFATFETKLKILAHADRGIFGCTMQMVCATLPKLMTIDE